MNYSKAEMFNRKASNPKKKPDQIIAALSIKQGQNIADIGAGGGYFSIRFAELVGPKGNVYAVDTNSEFLFFIKNIAREKKLSNLITVLSKGEKLDLPEKSIDIIYFRNVTHHIPNRESYFSTLKKFLKPSGKIAIIEYDKPSLFSFRRIFGHRIPKETIVKEMETAGYSLDKELNFLPEQSFTIYSIKEAKP